MTKENCYNMNEKNYIYVMKSIAVFCVVCAHVFPVPESANTWNRAVSEYLNYMGTMGVPIFFLLSGYLFEKNEKKFRDFLKGKIKTIFAPWIFCETMLWLYVVLRKGGITLKAWLLFMLGYQHTTYYLTVLIVLYILFWIKRKDWELFVFILISVFSMICTGWNFGISFINDWTGTFYLNPLNWLCFFAAGMLISRRNHLMLIANKSEKMVLILVFASGLYFVTINMTGGAISYFSRYALVAHIINVLLIFGLAWKVRKITESIKSIMIYIGKISFSIYLLHQFIAGILVRVTNHFNVFLVTLARPFMVVFIVTIMIWLIEKICDKRFRIIKILIGLR